MLLASAGAAAVFIPAINYLFYRIPDYDQKLAVPQLLSLIWDDEMIKKIGSTYRENFPGERKERVLVKALFDSTQQFADKLLELTRADFAEGRTVTVDGWVLSKTEARQCALYHIRHQKS